LVIKVSLDFINGENPKVKF